MQAWEGPGGGVFVIDDDVRVQSRGMGFRVAARLPGSDGLQVPGEMGIWQGENRDFRECHPHLNLFPEVLGQQWWSHSTSS